MRPKYEYLLKLQLMGDSGVGKSSLILRFADNTYTKSYISTIGVDFMVKEIVSYDKKIIKCYIYDSQGQDRFRRNYSSYPEVTHGALAVYDITDKVSFENLKYWIEEYLSKPKSNEVNRNPDIILVGAKCDDKSNRAVTFKEAKKYADEIGIPFIETSAKENINIEEAFSILANKILCERKRKLLPEIEEKESEKPIQMIETFLKELGEIKAQLKKECESSFTFSLDRKRLCYQSLNALEKIIRQDKLKWEDTQDVRTYIKGKIENIKNDPKYVGLGGGVFNIANDLFLKYTEENKNAQESSCNLM
jgi:Ras-related protein Rab-1A